MFIQRRALPTKERGKPFCSWRIIYLSLDDPWQQRVMILSTGGKVSLRYTMQVLYGRVVGTEPTVQATGTPAR
jgi:hypothetical protein